MSPLVAVRRPHTTGIQPQLLLLLAPYGLGLLGLLIPLLMAVPLAFTNYRGVGVARWAGLANFAHFAHDPVFGKSVAATLALVAIAAPVRGLVALGLALLLRTPTRSRPLLRYTAFLPTVMPDVAYALLGLALFSPLWGPLNWLLPIAGYRPDAWLLQSGPANLAVAITLFWTVGEGIVLLLAARQAIPATLYEAAALDGAGAGRAFRHITLPLLLPFQALLLCRDIVVTIGGSFVAAQIITKGGPYYATTYLPYWIYLQSTGAGQLGYAAALNLLLFALTLGILGALALFSRRWWRLEELA